MALAVELAAAVVLTALVSVIVSCIWIMTKTTRDEWP
jgi:hypothetical protein